MLLALAAMRLTRLLGWDDWPPIYKARAWVIGERWVPDVTSLIEHGERVPLEPSVEGDVVKVPGEGNFYIYGGEVELPGKQPTSEVSAVRPAYSRPLLAHLVHCPWCLSWWTCLVGYGAWLLWPHAVEVLAVPFAASAVVGVISKNLDA